jgi:hypothetical protein
MRTKTKRPWQIAKKAGQARYNLHAFVFRNATRQKKPRRDSRDDPRQAAVSWIIAGVWEKSNRSNLIIRAI